MNKTNNLKHIKHFLKLSSLDVLFRLQECKGAEMVFVNSVMFDNIMEANYIQNINDVEVINNIATIKATHIQTVDYLWNDDEKQFTSFVIKPSFTNSQEFEKLLNDLIKEKL